MSYIPGSNNGEWGAGMHRALFPKSMGGPFGHRGQPLPNAFQHPAPVGRSFGSSPFDSPASFGDVEAGEVYQLTPGGATTEGSWGFENPLSFGRKGDAARAMKLKHQLGISLAEAWKIVKGETKMRPGYKRVPCRQGQIRSKRTGRCRNVLSKSRRRRRKSPKRKSNRRKSRGRARKSRRKSRGRARKSRKKASRSKHQANAAKAMRLKHQQGISLAEAWSIVKRKND